MKKEGLCPCCGEEEEDQLHLYHCTNPEMQQAFKEAVATAKSTLVKDGIPSDIYTGFIGALCSAAHQEHPDGSYTGPSEEKQRVLDTQETLGSQAILKGFHHKHWVDLLNEKWVPAPPRRDGKKSMRKDAIEQTVALITCAWDIFEALWEARNTILHGDENLIAQRELNHCTARLLEFRTKKFEWLRRGDHFIIDHPVTDVIKWDSKKKQLVLATLEQLHQVFLMEQKRDADRLQPITNFFGPRTAIRDDS